ncbi:hypothetical protein GH714_007940 [Hevea brasiliensis]|uniref:Retrotransposon gag domain-containing protein n=1 Tax=Hevea brasiliensis TaxID=3981 RepID=A0A6A6M9C6_HEVBR|nr:hypothetical protein GH714_007940 [Hevea brasiliensis]
MLGKKLVTLFANKSRSRVMHIKEKLSVPRGSNSLSDYLQSIQAIAYELAFINSHLIDDDITIHVLNGVGPEFIEITIAIRAHETPISFEELHEKLTDYDAFLKKDTSYEIPIITANVTRCFGEYCKRDTMEVSMEKSIRKDDESTVKASNVTADEECKQIRCLR